LLGSITKRLKIRVKVVNNKCSI